MNFINKISIRNQNKVNFLLQLIEKKEYISTKTNKSREKITRQFSNSNPIVEVFSKSTFLIF